MTTTDFPAVPTGEARRLEARFAITTPMFIGDGNQKTDSIRPPSIKGALRFWWRALQWPRLYQQEGAVRPALARLHREEADLFGLAAGQEEPCGQARVTLRVENQQVEAKPPRTSSWVNYLLGQGLYHFRDGVLRQALKPGGDFTLVLVARPGGRAPTDEQWQGLEEALLLFGLLGGLGARARKGLGSISLQSLCGGTFKAPQNPQEYTAALKELTGGLPLDGTGLPPFSAFSGVSRLDISLMGERPMTVLDGLANQLQMYRGWGRNGEVNHQKAEQNFADDHDNMLRVAQGEEPRRAPRRTVFGLPHNYYFSNAGAKLDISSAGSGDRRASPLFMHVHQCLNGGCVGVQLLLPAVFLHADEAALKFKASVREKRLPIPPEQIDWSVIHRYLDRFESRQTLLSAMEQSAKEAQS